MGIAVVLLCRSAAGCEEQIAVIAFDFLHIEGEDLREMPLISRKACLEGFVSRAALPCLSCVPWFEDGGPLLATMERLGLEGVVSKRYDSPYRSGRREEWVKVKSKRWIEANRERWQAFSRG